MEYPILNTYFDIQKPFYYPGEQILGSIYIEFYESINCNQILIMSKGKQYIKINRKNISREIDDWNAISPMGERGPQGAPSSRLHRILQ